MTTISDTRILAVKTESNICEAETDDQGCLKSSHRRLAETKTHHVKRYNDSGGHDKENKRRAQPGSEQYERLRCYMHREKYMDFYCTDHDEMCCVTCILHLHRSCKPNTIKKAAKNYKSSDEFKLYDKSLRELLIGLKQNLEKRTHDLLQIEQNEISTLKMVDKSEEEIMSRVKDLAEISRKQIRDKYEEHKKVIGSDIDELGGAITKATECEDKLKLTNKQQLFTNVQEGKSSLKQMQCFLQTMPKEWIKREIKFTIDEQLKSRVADIEALGLVEDQKDDINLQEYKATPYRQIDIGIATSEPRRIYDMCLIHSGKLVLTDTDRNMLRRYDPNFKLDGVLVLDKPVALCNVDPNLIASRSFDSGLVRLISVESQMFITSSFSVGAKGFGMTYDTSEQLFYVCEKHKIGVYSKSGWKIKNYDKTSIGEQIFAECRHVALDAKTQLIYVTDFFEGFVVLDKQGHVQSTNQNLNVKYPWALCQLQNKRSAQTTFITSSSIQNTIIQLNPQGTSTVLLGDDEGLPTLYSAVYDHDRSRLLVCGDSQTVHVYSMSEVNDM